MRIAVSGTHGTGKSTLIEAFLARHPDYAHEPEPYVVLQELYGETFADAPGVDDFERQLEVSLDTIRRYGPGDDVIFERSPFDFLAYIMAVDESGDAGAWTGAVKSAVTGLDLLVFLPLDDAAAIDVPESEDRELRQAVDGLLHDILLADDLNLFSGTGPAIIEARGSVDERLTALLGGM